MSNTWPSQLVHDPSLKGMNKMTFNKSWEILFVERRGLVWHRKWLNVVVWSVDHRTQDIGQHRQDALLPSPESSRPQGLLEKLQWCTLHWSAILCCCYCDLVQLICLVVSCSLATAVFHGMVQKNSHKKIQNVWAQLLTLVLWQKRTEQQCCAEWTPNFYMKKIMPS